MICQLMWWFNRIWSSFSEKENGGIRSRGYDAEIDVEGTESVLVLFFLVAKQLNT